MKDDSNMERYFFFFFFFRSLQTDQFGSSFAVFFFSFIYNTQTANENIMHLYCAVSQIER